MFIGSRRGRAKSASPSLSPEAKEAIIRASYRTILHRQADPVGLQNHLCLSGDTPEIFRAQVAGSLSSSEEAILLRYPGRVVRSDDDITEFLKQGALAESSSPETLREYLDSHWFEPPSFDADPQSDAYTQGQMALYQRLSGFTYSLERERFKFDMQVALKSPYPYNTGSAWAVGDQLVAWGSIIRSMALAPGASVLEMGLGWGSVALQMAQMGYAVTGLDIEPQYVDLVRHRAQQIGVSIDLVLGDFFSVEQMDRKFDAVLFFESFHHCADHIRLLDHMPRLLNPGGKLVFAGETVDRRLPYPWGINCSGHGVWAICTHGWLELAFREDYLLDLLSGRGWKVTKHDSESSATAITYVCERA